MNKAATPRNRNIKLVVALRTEWEDSEVGTVTVIPGLHRPQFSPQK